MSGNYYIYIPFQDPTLLRDIHEKWFSPYFDLLLEASRKPGVAGRKLPLISQYGGPQPLMISKASPKEDTIYIVGHCRTDGSTLEDNLRNSINAQNLVSRMIKDGISPEHVNFKLWCCEGGAGIIPFAQLVFDVMRTGMCSDDLISVFYTPPYPHAILSAYTVPLYKAINKETGHKRAYPPDAIGAPIGLEWHPSGYKKIWG
jgi:hypothetical protein